MEDSHAARVTGLYSKYESISDDSDIKKSVDVPAICRKFGRISAQSLTVTEERFTLKLFSYFFAVASLKGPVFRFSLGVYITL